MSHHKITTGQSTGFLQPPTTQKLSKVLSGDLLNSTRKPPNAMRVRVSEAMAISAHVEAVSVSVSGSKDSHFLASSRQENKVLQGSNGVSLGTKLLKAHSKRNTHKQWNKHNQEKTNALYFKQLLLNSWSTRSRSVPVTLLPSTRDWSSMSSRKHVCSRS